MMSRNELIEAAEHLARALRREGLSLQARRAEGIADALRTMPAPPADPRQIPLFAPELR